MELVINEKKRDEKIKLIDKDGFEYTEDDLVEKDVMKVEALIRKEKFLDEKYPVKEKDFKVEMTKKVIMISLYDLGLNVMTNTYNLSTKKRDELQERMRYYEDISIDDINAKFNKVCNYEIFDNPQVDYSKLPIYNC